MTNLSIIICILMIILLFVVDWYIIKYTYYNKHKNIK